MGILKCHHKLEEKLGVELDLPNFHHPAILRWRVAERNGEIVQFLMIEKLLEFRTGGFDREAMQELLKEAPGIMAETKRAGIRYMHTSIPLEVEKPVARKLKKVGIYRSPNALYVADLRG